MKLDQNVERWMKLPAYQELMRQVHRDIYIGLKNGIDPEIPRRALNQFADTIKKSVNWGSVSVEPKKKFVTKVIACPKCKGKGRVRLESAYPRFHAAYDDCPDCCGEGKIAA